MHRFFIDAYGPDPDAERLGIEWLVREADKQDLPCAVVVPSVDSISNLERAIGRDAAEFAKRDRYFVLEGVKVQVFTDRTRPGAFAGPFLSPGQWGDGAAGLEDHPGAALQQLFWVLPFSCHGLIGSLPPGGILASRSPSNPGWLTECRLTQRGVVHGTGYRRGAKRV